MILAIQSVRLDASNGESVNLGEMGAESDAFCRCFLFPSPSLYTDDPYTPFKFRRRSPSSLYIPHNLSRNIQFYLSNCEMGGRIARPGQRFSDAGHSLCSPL
jgi:hypothetical protein